MIRKHFLCFCILMVPDNIFFHLKLTATFNFATSCEIHLDDPIDSAIPGDYNYDGLLDLLIISSAQGSKQTNLEYYFRQTEFPYFSTRV